MGILSRYQKNSVCSGMVCDLCKVSVTRSFPPTVFFLLKIALRLEIFQTFQIYVFLPRPRLASAAAGCFKTCRWQKDFFVFNINFILNPRSGQAGSRRRRSGERGDLFHFSGFPSLTCTSTRVFQSP